MADCHSLIALTGGLGLTGWSGFAPFRVVCAEAWHQYRGGGATARLLGLREWRHGPICEVGMAAAW